LRWSGRRCGDITGLHGLSASAHNIVLLTNMELKADLTKHNLITVIQSL